MEPGEISESTRLLHDLEIDGDDAEELLADLFQSFGIDTKAINWSDYFFEEASVPLLFRRDRYETKLPLTVGDIIECCLAGRWLDFDLRASLRANEIEAAESRSE